MFRKIIILVAVLSTCTTLFAQAPKRSVSHNQDFSLVRPLTLSVPGSQSDIKSTLESIVRDNGGVLEHNFFKRLFVSPKIILRSVSHIAGARGDNALKIDVSYSKITITYTTELSLQRAMELFKGQLAFRNGTAVIAGIDIIDWVDVDYASTRQHTSNLDLTAGTSLLPRSQIEAIIGRTKRGDAVEIGVVTNRGWVIETSALEGINPGCKIYSSIGYYGLGQLKSLNDYAASKGVELILKSDILSGNEQFQNTTGFAMNSVEGMRFVRAMFAQWTAQTGVTTFIIGKQNVKVDERYGEFLEFLQTTLNIKFIRE